MTFKNFRPNKIPHPGTEHTYLRRLTVEQVEADLRRDSNITIAVLVILATLIITASFFP